MTPADLGLPYKDWRYQQWEAIELVRDSPARFAVVEAPTGSGKSGIALALARLVHPQGHTLILTSTLQLQRQYTAISDRIVELRGRANFACKIDPSYTADEAICTLGQHCDYAGLDGQPGCPYFDQKRTARAAHEIVTSYAYAMADFNYTHALPRIDLLICDEAHTIEQHIMQFISVNVSLRLCARLNIDLPDAGEEDWEEWRTWAQRTYRQLGRGVAGPDFTASQNLARKLELLSRMLDAEWLITPSPRGWEFKPLWVTPFVVPFLLRHAQNVIFLSATLRPLDMFCEQIGILEAESRFVEIPSSFDKQRRPLVYRPIGRVKYGDTAVQERLVEEVNRIMAAHEGQKGLIHTVSYDLRDAIVRGCRYPERLITHGPKDRERQLEAFRLAPAGSVMISPSMGTGVDLPYELVEWQIICKLPFPNQRDPQIAKRLRSGPNGRPSEKGKSWSNLSTAMTFAQTYGRGMRAPDDRCVTYLLDSNWGEWFLPANKQMIPPWLLEAQVNERRHDEAVRTVNVDDYLQSLKQGRK